MVYAALGMVCGKCIRIHRTRGLGVCREVEVYAQLYHGGRAKEEAEVLWWMWLYWLGWTWVFSAWQWKGGSVAERKGPGSMSHAR